MVGPQRSRLQSEINVTPLIDVCLVLLIVFMVVTPLMTGGPTIELPKTKSPDELKQESSSFPILVIFDRPPQILFGPDFRWLSPKDFRSSAENLHAAEPNRKIVLRADRRVTYGEIKEVLRTLRGVGFQNVGLLAEREPGKRNEEKR
jgi:biopolymer transport protein TolR